MRMMRLWGAVGVGLLALAGSSMAGSPPKSWGPQVTPSNPRHLKKSELLGVVGPYGATVRCGGRPLLLGPHMSPPGSRRLRKVGISVAYRHREVSTGPSYVARCAGRGKVAWYVTEEDPLRKGSYPGAPITLSLPVPGVKTESTELRNLVWNGGCVMVDGVEPPCAPRFPIPDFLGKPFQTLSGTKLVMNAEVGIESRFIREGIDHGSARVYVTLIVDNNLVGEPTEFVLTGGEKRTLSVKKQFRLPAGRHRIGLRVEGSGYDYVNVEGTSAGVRAHVSRTFRLASR